MRKYVYDFYADPGHGWLKVSRKELRELSVEDKVSVSSYQRGAFVYLEEDCDAGIFLDAKTKQDPSFKEKLRFREHYANRLSQIRGYTRFQRSTD